jgi:hypothetical protein
MKQIPFDIYQTIKKINHDVKKQLMRKGVVVPVQTNDGAIRIGRYSIKKLETGFYSIVNYRNEAVVDNINLPQTAAILANKLALGKWLDDQLLKSDAGYGHALFEEELHTKLGKSFIKKNDLDRAELMFTKSAIAKAKKDRFKKEIDSGFEKLMNIR